MFPIVEDLTVPLRTNTLWSYPIWARVPINPSLLVFAWGMLLVIIGLVILEVEFHSFGRTLGIGLAALGLFLALYVRKRVPPRNRGKRVP
jgi:hypothetical protein